MCRDLNGAEKGGNDALERRWNSTEKGSASRRGGTSADVIKHEKGGTLIEEDDESTARFRSNQTTKWYSVVPRFERRRWLELGCLESPENVVGRGHRKKTTVFSFLKPFDLVLLRSRS